MLIFEDTHCGTRGLCIHYSHTQPGPANTTDISLSLHRTSKHPCSSPKRIAHNHSGNQSILTYISPQSLPFRPRTSPPAHSVPYIPTHHLHQCGNLYMPPKPPGTCPLPLLLNNHSIRAFPHANPHNNAYSIDWQQSVKKGFPTTTLLGSNPQVLEAQVWH